MEYLDGQEIKLGDIVQLNVKGKFERARVVMLGQNFVHLPIEESFEAWVKADKVLSADSIVIEWLGDNPLEQNDKRFAPVGNYMFTGIGPDLVLVSRQSEK